jgi:hypothetical protein
VAASTVTSAANSSAVGSPWTTRNSATEPHPNRVRIDAQHRPSGFSPASHVRTLQVTATRTSRGCPPRSSCPPGRVRSSETGRETAGAASACYARRTVGAAARRAWRPVGRLPCPLPGSRDHGTRCGRIRR